MKFATVALSLFFVCIKAQAFMGTSESGEVIPKGIYRVGAEPQFKMSDGSGVNFTGFFDMATSEDSSLRAMLGTGDTDFYGGASWKWVPFPDYEKQPAIGFKFEFVVAREANYNLTGFKVHPIVSKKWETNSGTFIPYAALPLGVVSAQSQTNFTINLAGGTEYRHPDLKNWGFGGELGLNLSRTFSYFLGFVTYDFDGGKPSKRRK